MFSKGGESDFLVLLLLLSTLSNVDEPRYAERLNNILERRLPRLRDLQTGDKELDFLIRDLIRSIDFYRPYRPRTNEAREIAEYTVERFRRDFERSISERFQEIERRLTTIEQSPRESRSISLFGRSDRQQREEIREIVESVIGDFRRDLQSSVFGQVEEVRGQLRTVEQTQERLNAENVSRNDQVEFSKAEIQSYLWLLSTGADIASINLKRYVPVRIYISDPVPSSDELHSLIHALDELSSSIGFERSGEFPSEQGSWWKQIFYRTKDAVSQEGVQRKLTKVEQAIQTNYLDKPQAEANVHQAEAVSKLVDSLKEVPDACIQVGSLLMVKTTSVDGKPMVVARTLTAQELKLLEENQPMLRCPDRILELLNHGRNRPLLDEGED